VGLAILLIDDDPGFAASLCAFLGKEGHHVEHASSAEDGLRAFAEHTPDVVLLDLVLPGMDGIETLKKLRQLDAGVAVVVMTAHGSITSAVEAMRLDALDYVTKPIDLDALCLKLDGAQKLLGLRQDLDYVLERDRHALGLADIVGDCAPMRAVYERVREVAKTDNTTVLLTGPSGTGKELVARAIHNLSDRRNKPLMQIDCTAIPRTLMESELFGHERGAFTGADRAKRGLLELAQGGTLLLDEIGDMEPELQSKLLRVLQERQFRRVGGARTLGLDVRVIAATHQDLDGLVQAGRFRQDLLYRLKVFQLVLPPLCERGDDIIALAETFIREFAKSCRKPVRGLDEHARRALLGYQFPGNVRELRNLIEQAVILCKGELITAEALSIPTRAAPPPQPNGARALSLGELGEHPLEAAEHELIKQALARSQGNKKLAAELLGISRFALQRKLDKLAQKVLLGDT